MSDFIANFTIQILNPNTETVGAGFVISGSGLAVSCAHVIRAAGGAPGEEINVEFYNSQQQSKAVIINKFWTELDDIAVLEIVDASKITSVAPLSRNRNITNHEFASLGFAKYADRTSHNALGKIKGMAKKSSHQDPVLELQGEDFERGMSGAAVFDMEIAKVVGMMTEYLDTPKSRIAYAVTIDTLVKVCPELSSNNLLRLVEKTQDVYSSIMNIQDRFYLSVDLIRNIRGLAKKFETVSKDILDYWQNNSNHPNRLIIENITTRITNTLNSFENTAVQLNLKYPTGDIPQRGMREISATFKLLAESLLLLISLLE